MHLPCHNGKVTLDKKMVCKSSQRHEGENRDYCNHFSVFFETTSKFIIAFGRLILKCVLTHLPGQDGEIDIRYEFSLKVILQSVGCKWKKLEKRWN